MSECIYLQFELFSVEVYQPEKSELLSSFIALYHSNIVDSISVASLLLTAKSDGLHLQWNRESEKPLNFHIDVIKAVNQLRSYPAPKQGAFNQALGKKTRHIIDATGGWGGDTLLMCTQGYQVTVLERNPVMALMLKDAMTRLSQSKWAIDNQVSMPNVIQGDSTIFFAGNKLEESVDCIYLDPMFPPKKKKTAAVNKQMQLLQWMVGQDIDAAQLVENALSAEAPRIVVKRPDYAEPLFRTPSTQFSSKLVHYDVYLSV